MFDQFTTFLSEFFAIAADFFRELAEVFNVSAPSVNVPEVAAPEVITPETVNPDVSHQVLPETSDAAEVWEHEVLIED